MESNESTIEVLEKEEDTVKEAKEALEHGHNDEAAELVKDV